MPRGVPLSRSSTLLSRSISPRSVTGLGHEGQFAPPKVSDRFAFSEETFAGRCGNEKVAPNAAINTAEGEGCGNG
jgi:hypothetical protein